MNERRLPFPADQLTLLFWGGAACILLAWIFTIWAALTGSVHWWSWTNLLGTTTMLASFVVRARRPQLANIVILAAGLLSLSAVIGAARSHF